MRIAPANTVAVCLNTGQTVIRAKANCSVIETDNTVFSIPLTMEEFLSEGWPGVQFAAGEKFTASFSMP